MLGFQVQVTFPEETEQRGRDLIEVGIEEVLDGTEELVDAVSSCDGAEAALVTLLEDDDLR